MTDVQFLGLMFSQMLPEKNLQKFNQFLLYDSFTFFYLKKN